MLVKRSKPKPEPDDGLQKQMLRMSGIRTFCQGPYESFKLPTGDSISGITDRPGVSCDNQCYSDYSNVSLPTQSFIKFFINNVEVHALIDTGSMRTFISSRIITLILIER